MGNRTTMVYNNTTTRYSYNNLHQLTLREVGGTTYNYYYDTNGNMTCKNIDGNEPTYMSYDQENRMTEWSYSTTTVNYVYLPFGKRVMRGYNGNTTFYFLQGINTMVEQYKASSDTAFQTTAVYTLAPGAIGYIISKRSYANGTTDYFYHYDAIGNVMFITDTSGNKVVDYVQEGFGNVLAVIGSLTTDNWHLTTKESDPQTGLYYFGARWYDPVIGRWITREPTGADGPNLYHYCFNDPINGFDPNGRYFTAGDAAAIVIGIGLVAGATFVTVECCELAIYNYEHNIRCEPPPLICYMTPIYMQGHHGEKVPPAVKLRNFLNKKSPDVFSGDWDCSSSGVAKK